MLRKLIAKLKAHLHERDVIQKEENFLFSKGGNWHLLGTTATGMRVYRDGTTRELRGLVPRRKAPGPPLWYDWEMDQRYLGTVTGHLEN